MEVGGGVGVDVTAGVVAVVVVEVVIGANGVVDDVVPLPACLFANSIKLVATSAFCW